MSEEVEFLSPGQQRRSLGEVKRREEIATPSTPCPSPGGQAGQKLIRTTVIIPGEIEWPDISPKGAEEILFALERLTPKLVFKCGKPTLQEITQVQNELRKEYRAQWKVNKLVQSGFNLSDHLKLRSSVVIGINTCEKAMDVEGVLKALLIEKDADPPIITRILIPKAHLNKIPIFAISGLNKMVYSVTKIRCLAFGLKGDCSLPTHHFFPLYETIMKYHDNPFPATDLLSSDDEELERRRKIYMNPDVDINDFNHDEPSPSKRIKLKPKTPKMNYLETQMRMIFQKNENKKKKK